MLFVISQIDQFPDTVITRKESHSEFFSLVCWARCFGRPIFKNNLRLRQKASKCFVFAEQNQSRIGYALICDCTTINENLMP